MNWDEEELQQKLKDNPDLKIGGIPFNSDLTTMKPAKELMKLTKVHKYNVSAKEDRTYKGITYDSKKEMLYAQELDNRIIAGEIDFWIRQVPFIVGNDPVTTYKADFMTYTLDVMVDAETGKEVNYWIVAVIEVKGTWTAEAKRKVKLFRKRYPNLTLEVV